MTRPAGTPAPVVRRLSLYLRQLEVLTDADCRTVSSRQLGDAVRVQDAQVRKDLANFGQFGRRGVGYRVDALSSSIRRILGTDRTWNVCLVGVGNLGRALVSYRGFARKGFSMVAVFDKDPALLGREIDPEGLLTNQEGKLRVRSIDELESTIAHWSIQLAVLAVPADAAQSVAQRLVQAGVRAILNFAPTALHLPPRIAVRAVDLSIPLEELSFQLRADQTTEEVEAAG